MSKLSFEQRWQQRFEKFALGNTEAAIAGWSDTGLAARVHFFKQFFKPQQGLWLDVGCGAGTYTQILANHKLKVIGLDYSYLSLKKASQKTPQLPWVSANVYGLPIAHEQCQGLLCFGVLQAIDDESKMLSELTRVIKPGGQLWLDGLNSICLVHLIKRFVKYLKRKDKHLNYTNPFAIKRLIKSSGCHQVKLYWAPIMPGRLAFLNPFFLSKPMQGFLRMVPFVSLFISHAYYIHAQKRAHEST